MFTFNLSYKVVVVVAVILLLGLASWYHYNTVKTYNAKLQEYKNEMIRLQNQANNYTLTIAAYKDSIKHFVQKEDGAYFVDSIITIIVHDTLHDTTSLDYKINQISILVKAHMLNDTLQLDVDKTIPSQAKPYISINLTSPFVLTRPVTAFNDKNTIGFYGLYSGTGFNVGATFRLNRSIELLGGVNINSIVGLHDWSDIRTYNLGFIYYIF